MRIGHILDSEIKEKLGVLSKGNTNNHPSYKNVSRAKYERLSESDLAELMGVNRQTYRQVNGKVKSK